MLTQIGIIFAIITQITYSNEGVQFLRNNKRSRGKWVGDSGAQDIIDVVNTIPTEAIYASETITFLQDAYQDSNFL